MTDEKCSTCRERDYYCSRTTDSEARGMCESTAEFLARRCKETGGLFVNVYLEDQAYGGPEEGGWYYDCGEVLEVFPVTSARTALRLQKRLETGSYSNGDRRAIHSVLSAGCFGVRIETHPGTTYPREKPHYC